jgi:hypothetical protein
VIDKALADMDSAFDDIDSITGRPSIPMEQPIRALLLQILFTIRSERQLMERLDYDLMFRWFVGLGMDDKETDMASNVFWLERLGFIVLLSGSYLSSKRSNSFYLAIKSVTTPVATLSFFQSRYWQPHKVLSIPLSTIRHCGLSRAQGQQRNIQWGAQGIQ